MEGTIQRRKPTRPTKGERSLTFRLAFFTCRPGDGRGGQRGPAAAGSAATGAAGAAAGAAGRYGGRHGHVGFHDVDGLHGHERQRPRRHDGVAEPGLCRPAARHPTAHPSAGLYLSLVT